MKGKVSSGKYLKKNRIFKSKITFVVIPLILLGGVLFAYCFSSDYIGVYREENSVRLTEASIPEKKEIKIGFATDIHGYITKAKVVNPSSYMPMQSFVKQMELFQPDVVVDGGDIIEGTNRTEAKGIADFKAIFADYNRIKAPKYFVLGNHELRSFSKDKWRELTGHDSPYYYVDIEDLRVIVLDGNFYPRSTGDVEITPGVVFTRGYVPQVQLEWLEEVLKNSKGKRKVVFLHQPPLNNTKERLNNTSFPPNSDKTRELLAQYKVMAVFSGHIEEAYHENILGVNYFVTPGFYKDEPRQEGGIFYKGVYSEIRITKGVEVKMYYQNQKTGQYDWLLL